MTRRLVLQALGMVAGAGAKPAAAMAQAAVGMASAASAAAPVVERLNVGFTGTPVEAHGEDLSPVGQAAQILSNRVYGSGTRIEGWGDVRPSIRCYKSASLSVAAIWEREARDEDACRDLVMRAAMDMLRRGRVPLL